CWLLAVGMKGWRLLAIGRWHEGFSGQEPTANSQQPVRFEPAGRPVRLTHRAGTRPRRGPQRRYSCSTGRCGMKARITAVSVMVGVCGLSAAASGQNALDRNLQVGSGGVNTPTRPDFANEVRMR